MKVSRFHRILFLLLVVLTVYFPAISGNYNTVDDTHIISAYGVNGQRTLWQILLPADQFYYRPVIELTYYLDNLLWGLDPSFMHLENILIHALNVVLVYLLAARITVFRGAVDHLPFISALLFAVHPIHTEAVSWIAGRTDLLAASFILLAVLFLFKSLLSGNNRDFILYLTAMLLSFLVKETSLMMVPASFLLFYSRGGASDETSQKIGRWSRYMYIMLAVAIAGYLGARVFLKPKGSDNAFSMLFQNGIGLTGLVSQVFQTLGFYVKKILFPLPLNFAITTIETWYVVPGILSFAMLVYFIRRREIVSSLFVVALIFIFPAILVRITGITWTPVAERYLYIPTAFFVIWLSATLLSLAKHVSPSQVRLLYAAFAFVACGAVFITYKRNQVWRDNFALYEDAVTKSPGFGDIHNELGVALRKKGDYQAARKHFEIAQKLSKRPLIREFAELNLVGCDLQGKSLNEKRDIIRKYIASHDRVHPELLRMLRAIQYDLLTASTDPVNSDSIRREIIALNDRIFHDTKDPHCLYSNGQLMLALGNNGAALDYFRKTVNTAPSDAYYYEPAKKLITRLENQ